jgi:hypothetical protein
MSQLTQIGVVMSKDRRTCLAASIRGISWEVAGGIAAGVFGAVGCSSV